MNSKNLLTGASVAYAWYALVLLIFPAGVFEYLYGDTAVLEYVAVDFLGGALLGSSVMCFMVRSLPSGSATSAILVGIAIQNLNIVYLRASALMGGAEYLPAQWIDLVVAVILGFGSAHLFLQARKSTPTAARYI
ncbi:MAG: hypothetical protein OXU39_01415 [Gemmatimonadota bacterium]|nr:hypothetical protein [Gemmatimonadota bacterium]MDE3004728.1 hypothetical protein [Gemmatimonadota bacterium]